jgi:hypothetical protein
MTCNTGVADEVDGAFWLGLGVVEDAVAFTDTGADVVVLAAGEQAVGTTSSKITRKTSVHFAILFS